MAKMGDAPDMHVGRRRPLRLASGLRARLDGAPRAMMPHVRLAARLPSPRHRNIVTAHARLPIPSDLVGVAAAFGVSLGAVLISIILGLVGPSWLVAASLLACGAALALYVAARKDALYSTMTEPPFAHPETR